MHPRPPVRRRRFTTDETSACLTEPAVGIYEVNCFDSSFDSASSMLSGSLAVTGVTLVGVSVPTSPPSFRQMNYSQPYIESTTKRAGKPRQH
jgi:hypothetical protein